MVYCPFLAFVLIILVHLSLSLSIEILEFLHHEFGFHGSVRKGCTFLQQPHRIVYEHDSRVRFVLFQLSWRSIRTDAVLGHK